MSSSNTETETLVDVTMPQMGVSVAEGTVVEWKKQVGDWVEADEIIASISTDKIDTDVEAPATGRVQEILVDVGTTVEVGTVMARIATDAKPGEAHRSESEAASGGTERGGRRDGVVRRRRRETIPPTRHHRAHPRAKAAGATRRSCSGSRPSTASTSSRSRGPAAAAGCASRTCWRSWRTAPRPPSRRCTSRARTGPTRRPPPKTRKPRFEPPPAAAPEPAASEPRRHGGRQRAAVAHAAGDRRAHAAVAADRGDVHDHRRGRHGPDRGGPGEERLHVPAVHRPRDDRHAARVPGAQRDARGRHASRRTTACTSASRSRSARAG